MAYKFQLGAAILSGSLTQEGQILAKDSALSGSSLSIGGTAVTATAANLNRIDSSADGFNSAEGKAMIRDADGLTIDGTANGNASFVLDCDDNGDASSLKIRQGNSDQDDIELRAGSGISLDAGSNFINASEINVLNSVTAGTAAASKALVLDSSLDIAGINTGSFGQVSASGMILAAEINLDDAAGIAGDGLSDSSGALTINLQTNPGLAVDGTGLVISLSGSTLTKDANGVSVQISGSGGLEETPNGLAVQLENGGGLVAGETGIELTMVDAGATVAVADDTFYFADSDNGDNIRSGSFVDLATGMAGNGISATNGVLAADLNGSSLLNGASGLSVNVVSLAGAGLVENSGVFDVGAGNGITVAADAVAINLSGSDSAAGLTLDAGGLKINNVIDGDKTFSNNITISGDLTVNGSTTTISTTELTVEDSNITIADAGDAATAGYGLTIGSSNTVTFQTAQTDGANSLASSVPLSASTYYGDGSNLTGLTADSAATTEGFSYNTYNAASATITNINGNAGFYIASGSSAVNPGSASVNTTIHLSGSWSNGEVVYIKAPSNASSFNLTVVASGNDRIDGQTSVVLESDFAAITLLRAYSVGWAIV